MDLTHYLGFRGVNMLSSAMANPRNLETLRLNNCGLTDEGCDALASALRSNLSHLRELDLSGNKLGDLGMMMLCAGLENNVTKIGALKLNDCGITYEGCRALASALASNTSHLRELDLSMNKLDDVDMMMLSAGLENPYCKLEKLKLNDCGITDEGCRALASALASNTSHLRELDLSMNKLDDVDMMMLSAGLENPYCKLEKLKLNDCGITYEGCRALASALASNTSHLRELDLSMNKLDDVEMMLLSAGLENPYCKLEKLKLNDCGITYEGCRVLASALASNTSHLRELDLSMNKLDDVDMMLLSAGLENPYCKLEKLKLKHCNLTDEVCATLASSLRSNPSHLRELDLSENKLGDFGIQMLCIVLEMPYCKLETLKLVSCAITDNCCVTLASALSSNPSHIRNLDLSGNKLGYLGIKLLSDVFESPYCKLETLKLANCGITGDGCAVLASALRTHLRELDLTGNKVDSGVNMLTAGLQNHYCQLETLILVNCGFTDEGCAALASALTSNSLKLRELDLSKNKLSDSGMKLLSAGLENLNCKLEVLRLNDCEVSDEGCGALASALTSNPSYLRELDLSDNKLGDLGGKMMCAGLGDPRCKLEILKLKHCGFTDEGCAALASVLGSDHSYLKYLDLSVNTFGDLGVQWLSAAFTKHS